MQRKRVPGERQLSGDSFSAIYVEIMLKLWEKEVDTRGLVLYNV